MKFEVLEKLTASYYPEHMEAIHKYPKWPRDINQRAASTVVFATGQDVEDTPKVMPYPEPTPEERHNATAMLGRKGSRLVPINSHQH